MIKHYKIAVFGDCVKKFYLKTCDPTFVKAVKINLMETCCEK